MKVKIIVLTLIMLLSVSCFSFAQDNNGLIVETIQICTSVEDRAPVAEGSVFTGDVERLYCFTGIKNSGETTKVVHVWYYKDKEMTRVQLAVGTPTWRTWSSKRILPSWTGEWRVDVLSADGDVLASKTFEIK